MDAKRVIIDAPGGAIRGPWDEPVRSALPAAVPQTDPRLEISEHALYLYADCTKPRCPYRKASDPN